MAGVSQRFISALFYWIFIEKVTVLLRNTIQHLTSDEPRDINVQLRTHNYHDLLEAPLGSDYFETILGGYDSLINDSEEGTKEVDPNEEQYQVLLYYPNIDVVIDHINSKRVYNSYDQYVGAAVLLPHHKGEKRMVNVSNHVKHNDFCSG